MAYAPDNRPMYDADSHIMELPDFLQKYADPEPARRHSGGELQRVAGHR